MEKVSKLGRRRFIQVAMAAAAASGTACTALRSPWRFLTVDEARTLSAICGQIIPPDQDPGAAWAGVVNYIDRQLCSAFKHLRQTYRQGIAAVNGSSRELFGADFVELDPAKQIEFLTKVGKGGLYYNFEKQASMQQFFNLLVDHTMQGFYGDPRHGGNRERTSWKMLGVPYPPIRGRLKYDLTAG